MVLNATLFLLSEKEDNVEEYVRTKANFKLICDRFMRQEANCQS